MTVLKALIGAAIAGNIALSASAESAPDYRALNQHEAMRVTAVLNNSCQGDLSDQATAMRCFRNSAFEAHNFAATTQQKIRNSGLPAGMTFPASHVIKYGCLEETRELGKPYVFAGMADLRDRITSVMNSCNDALRVAETLSQDVRGDFSMVFNYGTLNALASHAEWLDGIRPELLDVREAPGVN